MDLTDAQWEVLKPLMPTPRKRPDGRDRPWKGTREMLDGILWILKTGARWQDLPDRYPPYQTCHRRFQHWVRSGVLEKGLKTMVEDARDRGKLDLSECFIDGTFVMAKRRCVGPTKRGKGSKLMAVADRSGLPVAAFVASASPHEVTLVEETLASRFTRELPGRLIGDKAYDSDPLDKALRQRP